MSVVWEDEYDPSELDGFQVETELDWRLQGESEFDAADKWLADEEYARMHDLNGERPDWDDWSDES